MNKILFTLFGAFLLSIPVFSQNTPSVTPSHGDTANYPYWIQMMQDESVNFYDVQRAFNIYWQDRKITKGCGWKPFKRWEYMMQTRINPDGTRPSPDAVYQAYEKALKSTTSASGNWISQGPADIPAPGPAGYEGLGRLNVVAFHPTDANKIYVGSPSGGLWMSADAGATWATYTDNLPTLGVSAILVDKVNTSLIYMGTGDRDAGDAAGMGVFKSTDGGLTWTMSNTGMGNKTVGKLIQHPSNSQIVLAATSGGVYRSTDGGANWVLSKAGDFKDVLFKPDNPAIVYATASANFYRSTDNGVNFTQITSGLPSGQQRGAIAVTQANSSYVYMLISDNGSGYKGVYRSQDAGLNFTTMSTSPNILDWSCDGSGTGGQGWYDLAIAADPLSANTIYVGGVDIWKSTDGGVNWTINAHWYGGCSVPAVHADCHFLGYSPVDGQLYCGVDGGVYSTNNGGTNWIDHTVGMTIGQIYKLGQSQGDPNKVINGFQDNGTYTFLGSGWVATGGGDGMECAIDPSNQAYTYHTIYYGDIYRRYNNNSESHVAGNGTNGITESGAWVTPFLLSEGDPKVMFVGYKNTWRCMNVRGGSITWEKISDNLGGTNGVNCSVLENCAADPNILYVAREDHKLFRTDNCMDATPTWVNLSTNQPDANAVTDLETSPYDPSVLYLTAGTKVYKSMDKGVTWTDISGSLPGIHISTIVYYKNAQEGLYVGTDAGVYYRDQSTGDWISFSQGLPANGRLTELEIYYDNDSVSRDYMHVSTYGRGLWGSDLYHAAPTADFSADQTTLPIGCPVNFTDLSSGVPTGWTWSFPGGTPSSSNVKNPTGIVYTTPGTYLVKLVITNEFGTDSITKTDYINASGTLLPVAEFTSDKSSICVGETIHFTDQTINCPSSWSWTFNPNTVTFVEGTMENDQNPAVRFDAAGQYDVTLTAYNYVGPGSTTKQDYVHSGGGMLPFTENFESGFSSQSWTISNPDLGVKWDTITTGGTTPGSKSAWINLYSYPTVGSRDQLISPPFDLDGYNTVTLNFEHAYAQRGSLKDSLIVKVSSDCGANWTRILAVGPDGTDMNFITHAPTTNAFIPATDADWCNNGTYAPCYSLDLTPWAGMNDVKVMFESYNRHGNNLFIDNVNLTSTVGVPGIKDNSFSVSIYPNPSSGLFNIAISGTSGTCNINVYNLQGQLIRNENAVVDGDNYTREIDLTGAAKGLYYVKVIAPDATRVEKIMVR